MRKLISLCAAISMAVTAFATTASAAITSTASDLSIVADVTSVTADEYTNNTYVSLTEGYEAYKVVLNVAGVKEDLKITKAGPYNNGTSIDALGLMFKVDNIANVDTTSENSIAKSNVVATSANLDVWGGEITNVFQNIKDTDLWYIEFSKNNAYPQANATGISEGKTVDLVTAYIAIKEGTSVTFTSNTTPVMNDDGITEAIITSQIKLGEWAAGKVGNSALIKGISGSFTLGEKKEDAKLAISAKKETAVGTPTMDGHVWSVKLTKGSADITELNAVFTADGYEPAERTIKSGLDTLNKLTPDGEGFLNFYIGLKTSKPEVGASFTVKNGVDTDATWPAAN